MQVTESSIEIQYDFLSDIVQFEPTMLCYNNIFQHSTILKFNSCIDNGTITADTNLILQ